MLQFKFGIFHNHKTTQLFFFKINYIDNVVKSDSFLKTFKQANLKQTDKAPHTTWDHIDETFDLSKANVVFVY